LSNHGPLAAEALVELGHENRVIEFAKLYNRVYPAPYPKKKEQVLDVNSMEAIGARDRIADWVEYFRDKIEKDGWKVVVREWVPVLAPGIAAAAAHGIIRTGHAIRSLERKENKTRLYELAEGLGYWASYFQKLPENKDTIETQWPAADAARLVPMIDQEMVSHTRSISRKIKVVAGWEEFGDVINTFDISRKPEELISDLTETFAAIYAKHVNNGNYVSLIHSVTGTAMLRSIIPYLADGDKKRLIKYAWQMAAAIFTASGNKTVNDIPKYTELKEKELIKRAVESNEVHAIKFTEACLREYKIDSKPIFLIAVDDALGRLGTVS
ncbi:MAG: DUF4243 domain-containing protein, partial [Pyrinomonadaceae bacterium]|nr:DUF4243 domain-containing protein [Pyrinomonadaceae bacterium]